MIDSGGLQQVQTKLQFHYISWALSFLGNYIEGEHTRSSSMLPIRSTIDLLLEIETPNLRVTFKDFAIAEDREKAGGQFAEINRGNTQVTSLRD